MNLYSLSWWKKRWWGRAQEHFKWGALEPSEDDSRAGWDSPKERGILSVEVWVLILHLHTNMCTLFCSAHSHINHIHFFLRLRGLNDVVYMRAQSPVLLDLRSKIPLQNWECPGNGERDPRISSETSLSYLKKSYNTWLWHIHLKESVLTQ